MPRRCVRGNDQHAAVEATWGIYQRMITADRGIGKFLIRSVIDSVSSGVTTVLVELRRLGRTLTQRAADIFAYLDRPGTSNGPTEAINGVSSISTAPPSASAT